VSEQAKQLFLRWSMHAKLQQRLDELNVSYQRDLERIEREEIMAYDDDKRYAQLEVLKKELLNIGFLEEEEEKP
jgi:hypothetical protein